MRLNLGCGRNRLEGFVNIDRFAEARPDLLWDLERTPWPIASGSVTEIMAVHVLEHLGQRTETFLAIMQEIHRVLAPGGFLRIRAPHHRSEGYWGDPTHVRPINRAVMSLFSKANCRMFAARGWPNTPLADYLDIDLEIVEATDRLTPAWRKRMADGLSQADLMFAAETYANVIDEVSIVLRKVPPETVMTETALPSPATGTAAG